MLLKALFLGAPGVGKTQLFRRLCTGEVFDSTYIPSTGPDFSGTTVTLPSGEDAVLQVWDHPGLLGAAGLSPNVSDQMRMMQLMSGVHVALLVCDITSAHSLAHLAPLIQLLRSVNRRESAAAAGPTPVAATAAAGATASTTAVPDASALVSDAIVPSSDPAASMAAVPATDASSPSSVALVLLVNKAEPHLRPVQAVHSSALLDFCALHGIDLVLEASAALDTNIATLAAEAAAAAALMDRRRRGLACDPFPWRARAATHAAALRARADAQAQQDALRAARALDTAAAAERARLVRLAAEAAERARAVPVVDYAALARARLEAGWGVDDLARALAPRVRFDLETCGRLRQLFPSTSPELPLPAFRSVMRRMRAGVWAAEGVCERLFLMLLKLQNVIALPSRLYLPSAPLVPPAAAAAAAAAAASGARGSGQPYGPLPPIASPSGAGAAPGSAAGASGASNGHAHGHSHSHSHSHGSPGSGAAAASPAGAAGASGVAGASASAPAQGSPSPASATVSGSLSGSGSAVSRLAASSPSTPLCGRSLATAPVVHGAAHALLGYPAFLLGLDALLHGGPAQRALIAWAAVEDLAAAHAAHERTAAAQYARARHQELQGRPTATAAAASAAVNGAAAAAAAGADSGAASGAGGRPGTTSSAAAPASGDRRGRGASGANARGPAPARGRGKAAEPGPVGGKIAPKNTTNFDLLLRFTLTALEASPAFAAAVAATGTPPVELARSLLPSARKAVGSFFAALGRSYSYTLTKTEFIAGVTAKPELLAPWTLSPALNLGPLRPTAFAALAPAGAAGSAAVAASGPGAGAGAAAAGPARAGTDRGDTTAASAAAAIAASAAAAAAAAEAEAAAELAAALQLDGAAEAAAAAGLVHWEPEPLDDPLE